MAEFDEKGNIIKNKGTIHYKPEPKKRGRKYGKHFERSYLKLDPRG